MLNKSEKLFGYWSCLLLVVAIGCNQVHVEHPVGEVAPKPILNSFVGKWEVQEESRKVLFRLSMTGTDSQLLCKTLSSGKSTRAPNTPTRTEAIQVRSIENNYYFYLANEGASDFSFFRAVIDSPSQFTIYPPIPDRFREEVAAGRIGGRVINHDRNSTYTVRLQADDVALRKILTKSPTREWFESEGVVFSSTKE